MAARSVVGACAATETASNDERHETHETRIIQARILACFVYFAVCEERAIDIFFGSSRAFRQRCETRAVRIVGLDLGERRIGIAISDATRTLARPVGVLVRRGSDDDVLRLVTHEISRLKDEEDGLASIVVGLPRRLDGTAHEMTGRVEAFARQLSAASGLPVAFQDERLSSHEAESRLALREKDWRVRKQKLDAAAAAIILQDYLDTH